MTTRHHTPPDGRTEHEFPAAEVELHKECLYVLRRAKAALHSIGARDGFCLKVLGEVSALVTSLEEAQKP